MCKELAISGKPCRLAKNRLICHIHERAKARKLLQHSKDEVKNLNKTVAKKNQKIKEQQELMIEANNLLIKVSNDLNDAEKEVAIMLAEREEMKEERQNLNDEIDSMREDFNNYQIIRRFEAIKYELKKYVDISDLDAFYYFCKSSKNKKILRSIMGDHDNYWNRFNELRVIRNKVSHWYY